MVDVKTTIELVKESIQNSLTFVLEAGAGSGKTYTLMQTLEFLSTIELSKGQKILCITYTNVAKNEIISRLNSLELENEYIVSTIHEFLWSFMSSFQTNLQMEVKKLATSKIESIEFQISEANRKIDSGKKSVKIEKQRQIIAIETNRLNKYKSIDYSSLTIKYDKYTALYRGVISHNEIIQIAINFLDYDYFVKLLLSSYPYIMIDEYQDSDYGLIEKLATRRNEVRLSIPTSIGLFGDRMQQIYQDKEDLNLSLFNKKIEKYDNFRSNETIVKANNILRNDSFNQSTDCQIRKVPFTDLKFIYNLSDDKNLVKYIGNEYDTYKRLYLTNNVIANEVGFSSLSNAFKKKYKNFASEKLLKYDDALLGFIIENVLSLYFEYHNNNMFTIIKNLKLVHISDLKNQEIKINTLFSNVEFTMQKFIEEFESILSFDHNKFSKIVESYEDDDFVETLLSVKLKEYINLIDQVDGKTNLSTIHGVKGQEFEKVCVNIDEDSGWSNYDFKSLIFTDNLDKVAVKRSHKLLYVACTRAKSGLIINFICDEDHHEDEAKLKERVCILFGDDIDFITLR